MPGMSGGRLERAAFRFAPGLAGLIAFAGMALFHAHGDRALYAAILEGWGILPYAYPFLDIESILKAIDCRGQGVDVWAPNACMGGGWYSYGPLLVRASVFGLDAGDRLALGFLIAIGFFLALSALPPCRSWAEVAVLSAASVFAVERANLDAALFILTVCGVHLVLLPGGFRWAGYGAFVFAALLKFYPAVLMILAARERWRTLAVTGAAAVAGLAALLAFAGGDVATSLRVSPYGSPYTDLFGARNLPLGLIALPMAAPETYDEVLRSPLPPPALAVYALLAALAATVACRSLRRDMAGWPALPDGHAAFLVAGAVVIAGCFFATQNIAYRAIFLLLTLPGLFALARADGRYRLLIAGIVFLLWEEFFHHLVAGPAEIGFWLFREAVWWWAVARLASLLGAFLLSCPAGRAIRERWPALDAAVTGGRAPRR